jgi:glucose/mannose-6-phosphate isomerase
MTTDERGRDPGGMAQAIAALPDQIESGWQAALQDLRAAGWRGPTPAPGAACPAAFAGGVAACGMGGSAIGADMVRAALPRLPVPFESVRGFSLPQWVGRGSITIATSYSGETPETLSCAREAADRGCAPVCITSGGTLTSLARAEGWPLVSVPAGLQPRAALGSLLSAVAAVMQAAGLGADLRTQVPEAVELLRSAAAELGPGADPAADRARSIAERLVGRRVIVYGGGALAPAARRWKTQINENAKAPACFAEAPELLHNEVCGWADAPDIAAQTAVVVLVDPAGDDRLHRRLEAAAELVGRHAATVEVVEARGSAPLTRCLWTAHLGDWASYYLGLARGVDPTPVTAIDELKRLLRERER